jgi:fatty-acyl-CoA synthase
MSREVTAQSAACVLPDVLRSAPADGIGGFRFRSSAGQERFLSFADLTKQAFSRAARLHRFGLRRGERVALVLFEEVDMTLAFLAVVCAGLVPVLIAPRNAVSGAEASGALLHVLADSGARLVLTTGEFAGLLRASLPAGEVEFVDVDQVFADVAEAAPPFVSAGISPHDICFLQYTSGSTGRPKGVMITHGNVLANVNACIDAGWTDDGDRPYAVSWMPLYHDFGLIGFFLTPLVARVSATILSPTLFARRPRAWLDALHEHRATVTGAPNFAFGFLLRRVRDCSAYDLRRLRVLFCGGEPIRRDALTAFAERLAPAGFDPRCFLPCYGLAESTLAVTFHPTWHHLISDRVDVDELGRGVAAPPAAPTRTREIVSCGRPLAAHQVEVVGPDGTPLAERQVGEIRVRGPSVSPGYFRNGDATRDAWRADWLHTGDLGYFKDGHLYVCGRLKDLIIVRGVNYFPHDIEWTVEALNALRGRSVVAFPVEADSAESFVIIAECPIGDAERRAALCAEIAEAVVRDHGIVPADVRVVPLGTLPLTSSGKVQRGRTSELYAGGAFDDRVPADPATA